MTGRTHQIRVHLSHSGHPIVGDDKYGDFALNKALKQRLLSCTRENFRSAIRSPANAWRLEAPLPVAMADFVKAL